MEVAAKKEMVNNQLVLAVMAAVVVAWWQLPCDIVMAACSAKWKWLKKRKNNQPDIAVVAKVMAVVVAWQQHCHATLSWQHKWLQKKKG